jgi:hypothetical protein
MPDKQTYKEKNGTTRVGDALRWLVKQGKTIAPEILDLAGNITGVDGLNKLSDAISKDKQLTEIDKQLLLAELQQDVIEMQEITKRWQSDMLSDSWWSKNIRPLSLAFLTLTLFIYIILDSSINGFSINDAWIDLLSSLLLLVYGSYFGFRSLEKIQNNKKK